MPSLLDRLKDRKIVQWALAYLAGAFVVFQGIEVLADPWGLSAGLQRTIHILLVLGLFLTLIIAWYHGEKGRQRVSAAELLVIALLLIIFGGVLSLMEAGGETSDAGVPAVEGDDRPAIAVLPFDNFSPDPDDAYFADGMQDEIISKLSKIASLRVLSRSSTEQYRQSRPPIPQIARELNVDFVLEGSSRLAGDQVRLIAQLIEARSDDHVWSDEYDRSWTPDSVFAVQVEIAEQIARSMRAAISPEEMARLDVRPTNNPEAYQAYLRGVDLVGRSGQADEARLSLAQDMLEQAVHLDPGFGLAWAWLGYVRGQFVLTSGRGDERVASVRAAVDRAQELAPDLAETKWSAASYYYYVVRDFDRALQLVEEAENAWPNSSEVIQLKAFIQRRLGLWDEVPPALGRAVALDPADRGLQDNIAVTYMLMRQYDEAESVLRRAIELWPDNPTASGYLAQTLYYRDGDLSEYRAWYRLYDFAVDADWFRWHQAYLSRDFPASIDALAGPGPAVLESQYNFDPKPLLRGLSLLAMSDTVAARESFDEARRVLEAARDERPGDDLVHRSLGRAYAGLGLKEAAIREARRAVELVSIDQNAMVGPRNVEGLAQVYAMLGEADLAVEQLEKVLAVPARMSVASLRVDPTWDPIRHHPSFQALINR